MKRARSPLLSLAGVVLLGTVLLWARTRGRMYTWKTSSLPGERVLMVWVGGGGISFQFVDLKRHPGDPFLAEGFASHALDDSDLPFEEVAPAFEWDASSPGCVYTRCPIWFPGTLVGGLLLGWGLLCGRDGERISEPKEPR